MTPQTPHPVTKHRHPLPPPHRESDQRADSPETDTPHPELPVTSPSGLDQENHPQSQIQHPAVPESPRLPPLLPDPYVSWVCQKTAPLSYPEKSPSVPDFDSEAQTKAQRASRHAHGG